MGLKKQDGMVGCFGHGIEPSGFTKYVEFIDQKGPFEFPKEYGDQRSWFSVW
jgi:hypothetical protein